MTATTESRLGLTERDKTLIEAGITARAPQGWTYAAPEFQFAPHRCWTFERPPYKLTVESWGHNSPAWFWGLHVKYPDGAADGADCGRWTKLVGGSTAIAGDAMEQVDAVYRQVLAGEVPTPDDGQVLCVPAESLRALCIPPARATMRRVKRCPECGGEVHVRLIGWRREPDATAENNGALWISPRETCVRCGWEGLEFSNMGGGLLCPAGESPTVVATPSGWHRRVLSPGRAADVFRVLANTAHCAWETMRLHYDQPMYEHAIYVHVRRAAPLGLAAVHYRDYGRGWWQVAQLRAHGRWSVARSLETAVMNLNQWKEL